MKFNVNINPFKQEAIIETNYNDCEYTIIMHYTSIDEWNSFEIENNWLDIHFLYDKKFSVSIYPSLSNGVIKETRNESESLEPLKVNLVINLEG